MSVPVTDTAVSAPADQGRWEALRAWFGRRHWLVRLLIVVVGAFVALQVVLSVASSLIGGSQPSGPDSSSYATTESGLAAWAELLDRNGHAVERLRQDLPDASVPAGATVVVADPGFLDADEVDSLQRVLDRGGRVVVLGTGAARMIAGVGQATGYGSGGDAEPTGDAPEVAGVRKVQVPGGRRIEDTGALRPILRMPDGQTFAAAGDGPGGRGRLVVAMASDPFTNADLAEADNAAFALGVVGGDTAPVYFAEGFHGYGGRSSGWSAFPAAWRRAGLVLLVAVLIGLWAAGRRFGPVEPVERPFAPARRGYVDAMAAGLARGRRPAEAVAPVHDEVRRRLRQRTGLGPDVDDATLVQAASLTGIPSGPALRALSAPADDAGLVAVCVAAVEVVDADEGRSPNQPGGPSDRSRA